MRSHVPQSHTLVFMRVYGLSVVPQMSLMKSHKVTLPWGTRGTVRWLSPHKKASVYAALRVIFFDCGDVGKVFRFSIGDCVYTLYSCRLTRTNI